MSGMGTSESLRHEVRDIWNQNAEFWDERMGEGNKFHRTLIEPTQLRLLNLRGEKRVLDVACGDGPFARKMADLGATSTAVDAALTTGALAARPLQAARSSELGHRALGHAHGDGAGRL